MSLYEKIVSHEEFKQDTCKHVMTVLQDNGVYRHLLFKQPNSSECYFELVTWPGYLAITGDMGGNLFTRTNDMFEYFRNSNDSQRSNIKPGVWHQKLVTEGEMKGAEEPDNDHFLRVINEYRVNWMRNIKARGETKEHRRALWEAVDIQVMPYLDDYGQERAAYAVHEFSYKLNGVAYQFDEFFDEKFTKYTRGYIWRCRAIAWGIEQYDALKAAAVPEGEAT